MKTLHFAAIPWQVRLLGTLPAVVFTAILFGLFWGQNVPSQQQASEAVVPLVLLHLSEPAEPPSRSRSFHSPGQVAAPIPQSRTSEDETGESSVTLVPSLPSALPASEPSAESMTSQEPPLRLDSHTMRTAATASKSNAKNMAEVSNAYFGDDPVSEDARRAREVERAAKTDCLRQGAQLLTALVIAYELLTDKCSTKK